MVAVVSKEAAAGWEQWMGALRQWMFAEKRSEGGNPGEHPKAAEEPQRGIKRGLQKESTGLSGRWEKDHRGGGPSGREPGEF